MNKLPVLERRKSLNCTENSCRQCEGCSASNRDSRSVEVEGNYVSNSRGDSIRPDDSLLEAPEHVLSTLDKDGSRHWLNPQLAKGKFWQRRPNSCVFFDVLLCSASSLTNLW